MGRRRRPVLDVAALHDRQRQRAGRWAGGLVSCLVLLHVVALGRVVQLKTQADPRLADAVGRVESTRSELAPRGDLLDRRGRLIAATTIGYRLFVDPQDVDDFATIAVDLAYLLGDDPVAIDRRLHERKSSRYVVVRDQLEDAEVDAIRAARLRGVGLEPRLVREYPNGQRAARVIGTVGFEHTGLTGLEHQLDDEMTSHRGRLTFVRDARRRALWIEPTGYAPGTRGGSVQLSLDLVIQEIAERHLAKAVEACNAGGGRIVVLDCVSGEILAMHDELRMRPDWDETTSDPARDIDPALGRNRCLTDPYEPGSTFKPFVWAVATSLGRVTPDEVLPTPGDRPFRTSYGRTIEDDHYHENATWRDVLVESLNSGMAIAAERLSPREMQDAVARFGFGATTNCGLAGESRGIVTTPAQWKTYTQSSVAMGHEIAVTPVQMVRAFAAFARDGTMPFLRLTAVNPAMRKLPIRRRVVDAETARITRETLAEVMISGTGRRARSERHRLFGKSGTAQLPRREGGGYHDDRYVSSFIAGAPLEDPRIVVLIVIDDPDRAIGHYGGQVAGPGVRDVIDETLAYLGVRGAGAQ